jgi:hypothetical protein
MPGDGMIKAPPGAVVTLLKIISILVSAKQLNNNSLRAHTTVY